MKTLILVRHAKSSWKELNLSDFKRPLNKRGKRDAPFMGKLMKKMKINPEVVISSPAVRALETARIICSELGIPEKKIIFEKNIYEASQSELLSILTQTESNIDSLMMFGHNPGLTYLSNYLSGDNIDNIPTTGVVGLSFQGSWSELKERSCKLEYFEYPKKHFSREDE
jgi:phosphohistidine phosphatase